MSNKIKPKLRRRGYRLIVTYPHKKLVFGLNPLKPDRRRMISYERNDPPQSYTIDYSDDGRFAIATGHVEDDPVRVVYEGNPFQYQPAALWTDKGPWSFRDHDTGTVYISISDVHIANKALVASAIRAELDPDLATFIGVNPTLCDAADIDEFYVNHRYKELRNFQFVFERPTEPIGKGRHAENKLRHEHSNYEEMLEAAGGLLWPEQYDRLREGVGLIIRGV